MAGRDGKRAGFDRGTSRFCRRDGKVQRERFSPRAGAVRVNGRQVELSTGLDNGPILTTVLPSRPVVSVNTVLSTHFDDGYTVPSSRFRQRRPVNTF